MGNALPKILYIDDEKENLDVFYYTFSDIYDIFVAQTDNQALDILQNNEIEVLIADQKMPNVSGLNFINLAKNDYPDLVCIILTAYVNLNDVLQAINEANIYRFLTKPWNDKILINALNEAIETFRLRQKNRELILELQHQNTELEAAYKKVQLSDGLKSIFLRNLSHEVRTPLNGIMGFSQLLLGNQQEETVGYRFANQILKSSEQLLCIFDDIITMSLIQSDAVLSLFSEFRFDDLVNNLISTYEFRIKTSKNITVELINNESINAVIFSDKEKVNKVIQTLIDNAFKFTKEGEITVSSNIFFENNQHILQCRVADTGIGIDSDDLKTIFESFRQLKNNDNEIASGNGIGLTICNAYVEILNGTLNVESEYGKGSVFTVNIPVKIIDK